MISNDSTLTINLNEEYKIKIENGNEFKKSIFKEVYDAALKNVKEIINQSSRDNKYDDFNNIIAFTGERGKGKSSSMISFRNALVGKKDEKHIDFFNENTNISANEFATIDIVDPSLFRGGESLFEIILAQMFEKFQNEIKKNDCKISDDSRRNIIKQFQQVFENLQIINSDRKELYKKESIEALSRLATSSNLRKCFKDLITIYLNEFEEKKDFLVIAIDDFDLNISGTYEMLEEIRQFLIQSNIIVLISCKMEQLKETIKIRFLDLKLPEYNCQKTEKYLEKLFPFSRRLILPEVKKIKQIDFEIKKDNEIVFESKSSDLLTTIKMDLYKNFNLIFDTDQIGLIFNLETIRGIQNYFNLSNSNNITTFKNYLLNEISKNNIETDFFTNLNNVKIEHLNLSIIKFFHEKYKVPDLRSLINSKIPDRISVGDVIFSIKLFENETSFNEYHKLRLIETLKIFYIVIIKEQEFLKNDIKRKFGKNGFVYIKDKILPAEDKENGKSRNFLTFGGKEEQIRKLEIDFLDEINKFIFTQFVFILGDNENYRNEYEKEILTENYKKITLSPFAIFSNIFNRDTLIHIFNIDINDEFIVNYINWSNNSKFIDQLFNPSFSVNYHNNLNKFRTLYVKVELPDNYFDCLVLLFVYGSIYSIDNNEIVTDFLNSPIVRLLLKSFDMRNNKSYSIVNKINAKYSVYFSDIKNDDNKISNDLIKIFNKIFTESIFENEIIDDKDEVLEKLKKLSKRIKARPGYKIQTLTTIINEIKKINESHFEVKNLSMYKEGINSLDEEKVNKTKVELLNYLNKRING